MSDAKKPHMGKFKERKVFQSRAVADLASAKKRNARLDRLIELSENNLIMAGGFVDKKDPKG